MLEALGIDILKRVLGSAAYDLLKGSGRRVLSPGGAPDPDPAVAGGASYRVELGRRHRDLRERVLQLDIRRMADFYGYDRASELERYEAGDDELPTASIQRLTRFFFVNDAYLRGVSPAVFRSLFLDDAAAVGQLLDDGFRMYFLCCPERREDLLTFPLLHKHR